tara:strand:+ start:3682 stop:4917 length:1236 start_codon:yes stop_codon:yes gene_type:complete
MARRVAYLTGEYLRISPFVFIHREVQALRRLGVEVGTFSVRGLRPGDAAGPEQLKEQAQTGLILPTRAWTVATAHLRLLATHPTRYLRALGMALKMRQPGWRGLALQVAYLLEAGLLARMLQKGGYSHLHNHMGSSSASVACLASVLADTSFSFTIHGTAIRTEPHRWRIDVKAARAAFVICVSEFGRRQTEALIVAKDRSKIHVVHCGVQPTEFEPAPQRPEGKHILFVGRLVEDKGIGVLLKALARLKQRHESATLTLVGDGPDREAFTRLAERLGLSDAVNFHGHQDPARIKKTLKTADLFVLPSFAEGIPVVLMEAMATALPVVSTDISGIPELVETGVSGLLVPPGDVDALAQALDRLLSDFEERFRMAHEGRKKVLAHFDVDKEAGLIAGYFDQVPGFELTRLRT